VSRLLPPLLLSLLLLAVWEVACRSLQVPVYFLPPPSAVAVSLVERAPLLAGSALQTFRMALQALLAATLIGGGLALAVSMNRPAERAVRPLAVALQVTPVVAIAPLVVIWSGLDHPDRAVVALAAAVAIFPIFSGVLTGLKSADPDLERLLVRLRRDFLLRAPDLTPARLSFAASLAQQAHNNEFVFVETAEEQAAVRRLVPDDARNLLRLAMYRPLTELADAEDLLRRDWPKPVAALIEGVLRPHLEELDLKRELQSFSPIEDGVSALVSDHYEHNPYPRWFSLTVPQREHRLRALEGLLGQRLATGGGKLQVLVAGGGTGKQSILAAIAYGDSAEVLAIDLSRTSLAYSMRKAREYNVRNLKHLHGDLLEVGRLPQAFDIVECTGVLVCVRDPQAALAALVAKLKPGGLIYLALYSEAARADVVAARQMIAELGIGDSPDEMRRFRHTMITGPDSPLRTELLGSPGFYSLSTCRDFLFHRVEHRFSLAQVDGLLRSCGLRFFCWDLPAGVLPRFRNRFGAAADPRDLALWEVYERENPRTFRGMYNFWCRQEG